MALAATAEMLFPRLGWWSRIDAVATLATLGWVGVDVLAFYFG